MSEPLYAWAGFILFVFGMLMLDLGVFQRKSHVISIRESLLWTAFWIALALLFNLGLYYFKGKQIALEFLAGYLIEKSLSVDNIFIFLLIFSYFKVPPIYQHKVLFWGILGAIVIRFLFIIVGISLIHRFHFIIYIFGGFLVYTGFKMMKGKEEEVHPENNPVLKFFSRFMPVTSTYEEDKFFVRRAGKLFATPLVLVLLMVETTDIIFAVDSIPAIFGVTLDPFIVFTSNIFAILGLRALYFALCGIMDKFHYLSYGLAIILIFVGIKMLVAEIYHIPIGMALGFIGIVLVGSVVVSLMFPAKDLKCPPGMPKS